MQTFIAGYCEISLIKSASERRNHFEPETDGYYNRKANTSSANTIGNDTGRTGWEIHGTFEENQLHSFVIAQERDSDKLVGEIERFLPFVDNWATCDQLSCRGLAANPDAALAKARAWLESDHEYTVRFAIGVLMELFLDERFRPEFFAWVIGVSRPEYYVNMMGAWYFAEALAKQPAAAEAVIASGALDEWTHNKAIQKAVESRRISPEQKDRLRAMKRRS